MPSTTCDKPRVLLLARDARWEGGVVNFVGTLRSSLGEAVTIDDFTIGRRRGRVGRLLRVLFPVLDALRLWTYLRGKHYEACHLNPSLDAPSVIRDGLMLLVLRLRGMRNIVVSFHGWDLSVQGRIGNNAILLRLFRWVYDGASHILVLAPQFAAWLEQHGFSSNKTQLFTTMFDPNLFKGVERHSVGQRVELLFMGRLVIEKGVYELLAAFKQLVELYGNLHLTLAGSGPEIARIESWINSERMADRIALPGYLQGKAKAQLLLDSDIFILPSYSEGCPVAMLEAMAAGLPVVATAVGGIPGVIGDGVNGVLLRACEPSCIAEAVRKLIDCESYRANIGLTNREEAWAKYSARAVAGLFEGLYSAQAK